MVWLLGEYGENILESPYILEAIAKNFLGEEPQVQLQASFSFRLNDTTSSLTFVK